MMLMLITKLLKKVLAILLYILRRKILKGKFVENGREREIKYGLDKHDSERKSPDSDKKKHLKKETRNARIAHLDCANCAVCSLYARSYVHF
jgi:hypothetical protein